MQAVRYSAFDLESISKALSSSQMAKNWLVINNCDQSQPQIEPYLRTATGLGSLLIIKY